MEPPSRNPHQVVIGRDVLDSLLDNIRHNGFRTFGPTIREGAIVFAEISGARDLPRGWTEVQDAGTYRLKPRDDDAFFGFAVGPHSPKKHLLPPTLRLWRAARDRSGTISLVEGTPAPEKIALIGVRSCDLHAIAIMDRVTIAGEHTDPYYAAQRESMLLVAINCSDAGGTCFCVSMRTGPRVTSMYDLAITELIDGNSHEFLVEVGSAKGAAVIENLLSRSASESDVAAARAVTDRTASQMGRRLETDGIKELLYANLEHPRWNDVASRCLSCTNCTMVCPTCFCTNVDDSIDLSGSTAERVRRWDSCHTTEFSHLHGGSVRTSIKSRYRQWMTHKLASWIDQFGSSGCVGCGRCITWCPVGIDITEEAAAIRASDSRRTKRSGAED